MSPIRFSVGRRPKVSQGGLSFSTTPHSHRITGDRDNVRPRQNGTNKENLEKLANIVLGKSLSIYKASPLYNLNFKTNVLKALARKICLHIQKVDMWGESEGGAVAQNLIKVTAVSVIGDRDQQTGILVRATATTEYGDNGDVDQTEIFWGLFCKPVYENSVSNIAGKFLDLPLVLVKGRLVLIQEILKFFTKQFDCTIEKFHLAPLELTWLAAMWAGFAADIPRQPLKLVYTSAEEITGIDTITTSMGAKDVENLWKCIHDEDSDSFLYNEVAVFTKSLEAHFEKYFKLNLAFCTLKCVMVTSLNAESSGRIKIFSPRTSYRILAHILTIIQQEMNV